MSEKITIKAIKNGFIVNDGYYGEEELAFFNWNDIIEYITNNPVSLIPVESTVI